MGTMFFKNGSVVFSIGVGSNKSTKTQYHLYIGSFGSYHMKLLIFMFKYLIPKYTALYKYLILIYILYSYV